MKRLFIHIDSSDNVAVALQTLEMGTELTAGGGKLILQERIPRGYKFALTRIERGDTVIKYGYPIGNAAAEIAAGHMVHTHNMTTGLTGSGDYVYSATGSKPESSEDTYFMGCKRSDGRTGTRNELWIIPTVGCANALAQRLERSSQQFAGGAIDAVAAFPHPYGCSQTGEDQERTRRLLASLVQHPNAGGVLVIGLGCENTNIGILQDYLGDYDRKRIRFLNMQDSGDEVEDGMKIIEELAAEASLCRREEVSCEELVIGLKCGGSDGLSGLTANPLTGRVSDMLIARGGSSILTEVPEMFGAEQILLNRCADKSVFSDAAALIQRFKDYYTSQGEAVHKNPAPGNIEGGITTLEDKSLGCVQKAGTAPVSGVIAYGNRIPGKGLHLLESPGNDIVSTTALAAAGAQLILFTTGRGTPLGSPVPTIKISSNSDLFTQKPRWIDFDAGILTGNASLEETAQKLFSLVIETASGRKVLAEKAGYRDIALFKTGVTL